MCGIHIQSGQAYRKRPHALAQHAAALQSIGNRAVTHGAHQPPAYNWHPSSGSLRVVKRLPGDGRPDLVRNQAWSNRL